MHIFNKKLVPNWLTHQLTSFGSTFTFVFAFAFTFAGAYTPIDASTVALAKVSLHGPEVV